MTQTSATNRKVINVLKKEAAERDQIKINFLAAALSTIQGRLWFYDLLAECGIFHNAPSFDPHRDYFDSGQRNVGLRIQALILTHAPDAYLQLLKDENDRQSLSASRQQPGSSDARGDVDRSSLDADIEYELYNGDDSGYGDP